MVLQPIILQLIEVLLCRITEQTSYILDTTAMIRSTRPRLHQ